MQVLIQQKVSFQRRHCLILVSTMDKIESSLSQFVLKIPDSCLFCPISGQNVLILVLFCPTNGLKCTHPCPILSLQWPKCAHPCSILSLRYPMLSHSCPILSHQWQKSSHPCLILSHKCPKCTHPCHICPTNGQNVLIMVLYVLRMPGAFSFYSINMPRCTHLCPILSLIYPMLSHPCPMFVSW